ncbi:deoxyribose-phosphate aldolase [Oscillatoria sp. FACHB-1406]|uniref:deoxyribose-phosphate aldolase n=1 Tax=Oscillatoria sp. FACHB-1406 TaxID=2692846 RepID=UPI001689F7C9|nr:deoxyribose-phosphate aldolase [Oscillatoria sp. FACHB-1406]MBD2580097.1 deoxyribose-phosphate aldolase [Oscillatoria sp. FACHB-1406]
MAIEHPEIDLAEYIELALLQPAATREHLRDCCDRAVQYNFPAVCVYPSAVKEAAELLHGKHPGVCAVIGFPAGATTTATKRYEAQEAVENGATELDVVLNLGWLKMGDSESIYREVASICEESGQIVKVILEMALLTPTEKRLAAEICMDAGAAYLKTSTGWFGGATLEDVRLLKEITKGRVGIKAAGGIHTAEEALELVLAGATRLGTSRGVELLHQRNSSR